MYAYSEGRLTENARNMQFNGAPVLFVPGNSGSYKQARSLASVALRKGLDNNWSQHLDYFTSLFAILHTHIFFFFNYYLFLVDFNEEHSALFGGYLDDQATYLDLCIKKVLGLYQHLPNKPESIAIVAHSMVCCTN